MTQPPTSPWAHASGNVPHDASAEQLAALAASRPDLWPQIVAHPHCYAGLQEWIAAQTVQLPPPQAPATPLPGAVPEGPARRTRRGAAWLAGGLAAALVLAGGGVALALTDTWPFGAHGPFGAGASSSTASTASKASAIEDGPTFADGIEEAWTIEVPSLGGDLLMGGFGGVPPVGFPMTGPLRWHPKSIDGATLVPLRAPEQSQDRKLVLLDNERGSEVWSTAVSAGTEGPGAGCIVGLRLDRLYCGVARGSDTDLIVLDKTGELERTAFTGALQEIAVDTQGVSIWGDGAMARVDLDGKQLWAAEASLSSSKYNTTLDVANGRTLLRSFPAGWELFDSAGKSIAKDTSGAVNDSNGPGNLKCDAMIAADRLFLFGDCDTSIAAEGMSVTRLAQVPQSRAVYQAQSDVLVVTGSGGSTAYDSSSGSELWSEDGSYGATYGNSYTSSSVGSEVLEGGMSVRPVAEAGEMVKLKGGETGSIANTIYMSGAVALRTSTSGGSWFEGYDDSSGDQLWCIKQTGSWSLQGNDTGLLIVDFDANGVSTTLTRYAPAATTEQAGNAQPASATAIPKSIPVDCPADTILLAWAEFADGWVLVCGVSMAEPTFMAYQSAGSSKIAYSVGAKQPTGADAKAAVHWDAGLSRYSAELEGGDKVTLDYDIGTAVRRDAGDRKTVDQHRFVRYIFVPLGEKVRTIRDASQEGGAFDVQAPEDTAEDQVRYMIEVLEKAYSGRALVKDALPKLQYCTASAGGYGDTVAAMEAVRDNRGELLEALDAMPVDKIPEGSALLDDLYVAIDASHRANLEYVAWAEQANANGCASLSSAGERAAAESDPPKERFASRWNRVVAPKFGVRTFDAWYI
ncbi:variant leucine-rich repeat-containing protein [Leucobacter sp. HY1908]